MPDEKEIEALAQRLAEALARSGGRLRDLAEAPALTLSEVFIEGRVDLVAVATAILGDAQP